MAMDVLALLLSQPGRVVTTEEILDTVWADRHGDPGMVQKRIAQIRQILSDDARQPSYIETIRQRGYRTVAQTKTLPTTDENQTTKRNEVDLASDASSPSNTVTSSWRARQRWMLGPVIALVIVAAWYATRPNEWELAPDQAQPLTLAVLPFLDMSPAGDQEYFADGIAEEIASRLAEIPSLTVIAPSSSFSFKGRQHSSEEIGEALNVAYVLDGSVRTSADRIRITARLIDTTNNSQVWTERFDDLLVADTFRMQDDVALGVTKALSVDLVGLPPRRTVRADALDALLRGRHLMYQVNLHDAVTAYTQAVILDPDYVEAWDGLARAQLRLYQGDRSNERREILDQALHKVLTVNPLHAYARLARANRDANRDFRWQQAIDDMHRLLTEHPNDVRILQEYSNLLSATAQYEAAIEVQTRWLIIDPINTRAWNGYGNNCVIIRDLDCARTAIAQAKMLGKRLITVEMKLARVTNNPQALLDIANYTIAMGEDYPRMRIDGQVLQRDYYEVIGEIEKAHEKAYAIVGMSEEERAAKFAFWIDGDPTRLFEWDRKLQEWPYGRPWRRAANLNPGWPRRFWDLPGYQEMLKLFRLDDATITDLVVPALAP